MSYVTWVILIVLIAFMVYRMMPAKGITNVNASELANKLQTKGTSKTQFIDVREPSEYKGGHIKAFKNIPLGQLKNRSSEIAKDQEVVVICRSGGRSMQAARVLKKQGFSKVTNVSGGMLQWKGNVSS